MKTIDINKAGLNLETKNEIKKAMDGFDRGDFRNAYNNFFRIYSNGTDIEGLQLSIGLCLLKMNKKRQGQLFITRELLEFPGNREAVSVMDHEVARLNGRTLTRDFFQTERPDTLPEISVVMIVKNEEKDLPRCLESIKDIAKEIIILDTGSTDRTVEIAKSYNARVEHFEWCNDFSIARNESLKYATSEWILRLDADEYMEEIDKARLLHCAKSGIAEVYLCPMISPTKSGIQVDVNVRLIKNHLGIKFTFPIHETVFFSVKELGLNQCVTNVNFQHTGYAFIEEGSDEKKISRNVIVCNQFLEKNPDNYYVRLIRNLFMSTGIDKAKAIEDMEDVIQNLPEDALPVRYLGLTYLALIQTFINQNREVDLSKVLMDMQIDFFFEPRMMQYAGEIYLYVKGDWRKAKKHFEWVSKRDKSNGEFEGVLPKKKYNQIESLLLLTETMLLENNLERAKKTFSKTLSLCKKNDESSDKNVEIEKRKKEIINIGLLDADELRHLAQVQREQNDWANSYKNSIFAALKSQLNSQDYINMAYCQIQMNYFNYAQILLDKVKMYNPEMAVISNLEAVIEIKKNNPEKAINKAIEALIKEPGNQNFQSNVQQIAKLLGMTPVQAIRKTGLNWLQQGNSKNGLFALMLYLKFEPQDEEIASLVRKNLK